MDIEELLKLLHENAVDFVIIGATAFPVHGYARATLDVDIFIRPTRSNAKKTLQALQQFGYDMTDISIETLLTRKVLIRQYAVETDIHPFVTGVSFTEVWKTKIPVKFGQLPVYFASLDELIKMKEAAGRDKDKEDLKYLRKIQSRRKDQKSRLR